MPFAVTSLLVLLLIPSFGIATYRDVVRAGFGDPVITFFIGVLILSAAFTRSGLGTRLVYHVLLRVGTRTDRVLLGFLVVGVLISMWITNMAVAAMLLPIGLGLLRDANVRPRHSNFGRCAHDRRRVRSADRRHRDPGGHGGQPRRDRAAQGAGARRHLVRALDALRRARLRADGSGGVAAAAVDVSTGNRHAADHQRRRFEAGSTTWARSVRNERRTLVVFAVAIAAWILAPFIATWTSGRIALPAEGVGLAAGLSLLLPGFRVLTWKEAEQDIDWGGIMLIVAGLSLGTAVYDSGAARWLAWVLLGHISSVPDLLRPFVIVLAVAVLRLMFSSNTVTASIITPILVALARDLQLDAWTIVAPAAFSATLGFILVSQGPTTIIPYGAGYFSIKDMAKAGVLMTIAAAACIAVSIGAVRLVGPVGLSAAAPASAPNCESLSALHRNGVNIRSARGVEAGALQRFPDLPAFCRVEATLTPTADSEIGVEIWLPAAGWNGNLQAVGNRGWGGSIMLPALAGALGGGYAGVSTDTGHTGGGARFALGHPEKLVDAGDRAVHETTVIAKSIVETYYGRAAKLAYWNGCSLGGRQGLTEAQRYPADYDGIVVGDAAYDVPNLYAGRLAIAGAVHRTQDNVIPSAALPLIHKAALAACDALDGVTDGVIENPRSCRFDPGVLACKGTDSATNGGCLTTPQIDSVRAIYAPVTDPRTGVVVYPGLEPGSELGWGVVAGEQPENNALDMFRFIVFNDASWNWRTFTLAGALDAIGRTQHIDAINAVDANLRPYLRARRKAADVSRLGRSPDAAEEQHSVYYEGVVQAVGTKTASGAVQLFMVPGMGHCEGGDGTDAFDKMAPLAAWVERREKPTRIAASRVRDGVVERTRPLCPFPSVAKWAGKGSTDDAANFECVVPK